MHPLDSLVIYESGRPTQVLLDLLKLLGLDEHDGSLASIVTLTQARFFQKKADGATAERWELAELPSAHASDARFRAECVELFRQMGMIDEIAPVLELYRFGGVLGALVTRVRSRIAHLSSLWSEGSPEFNRKPVRFEEFVFFGSERPLIAGKESLPELVNGDNGILPIRGDWRISGPEPTTELEMMKFIWNQAVLPDGMRDVPVTWVNARMKPNPNGPPIRANTEDTGTTWVTDYNPAIELGDAILFISNQPHVASQDAALRTVLPPNLIVETVGRANAGNDLLALYCRELAGRLRHVLTLLNRVA